MATSGGSCAPAQSMTEFLGIGSMGDPGQSNPNRVSDGGPYHVSCSVKGGGSNFSISVDAISQSTTTGGSMSLSGSGIDPSTGGMNLSGTFVGTTTGGQYTANDCVLTYSTPEGSGGIAPGRIWGHVECDAATNGSVLVSGGAASTCKIEVDFVFENCSS